MIDSPLEQEPQPVLSFKDALIQTSFTKGRVLPPHVKEIELGIFGDEAKMLVDQTLKHPKRYEFGKQVHVTSDKKVLLQNQPTEGDEDSVTHIIKIPLTQAVSAPSIPWYFRQAKMVGSLIHSHPYDLPPSPADISHIMLGDSEVGAMSNVFVATEHGNILIFRGENTPHWVQSQAEEMVAQANKVRAETLKMVRSQEGITEEGVTLFDAIIQIEMLEKYAELYDLRIFVGEQGDSRVTLKEGKVFSLKPTA